MTLSVRAAMFAGGAVFSRARHRRTARLALALWGAVLVATPGCAGLHAPAVTRAFELRPGVIVDPGRGVAYVGGAAGGIEAVDLSSGRSLWKSAAGALPLALHGRFLVAQGEEARPGPRLPIAVLDDQTGGRTVLSSSVSLPEGVQALVTDDPGRSFRATAEPVDGGFLISWTFQETVVQGMARSPGEPPPAGRTLAGAARVNVASGTVVAVDVPAGPPTSSTSNALATVEGGRGGPLTLKRRDARTGQPLPDLRLMEKALVALPSADRDHLLASERVGAGGPDDPEYRWSIFSMKTGELLGQLRRDASAAPFLIWKDRIVFESRPHGYLSGGVWIDVPMKILSFRLPAGDPSWDRAVRDLEYRGPTPPVP